MWHYMAKRSDKLETSKARSDKPTGAFVNLRNKRLCQNNYDNLTFKFQQLLGTGGMAPEILNQEWREPWASNRFQQPRVLYGIPQEPLCASGSICQLS